MLKRIWPLLTIMCLLAFGALDLTSRPPSLALGKSAHQSQIARGLLLPGEQIILGTVQHIKPDVIQANVGHLEPLFLSSRASAEKGIQSIQRGDKLNRGQ